MPKTENRYLASATVQQLYPDPESMPWDHIEREVSAARRQTTPEHLTFSEVDRIEIHLATNVYAQELAWCEAGVPKKAVDDLRDEILCCTGQLMGIAKLLYPMDGTKPAEVDRRRLEVLGMLHNTSEFSLSNELSKLAYQASVLDHHLNTLAPDGGGNLEPIEITQRKPELLALEGFIRHLLNGIDGRGLVDTAKAKPARSTSQAIDSTEPLERELWGIPVGENSKVFTAFVNAVLRTGPKVVDGFQENTCTNRLAPNWHSFEDKHALPEGHAPREISADMSPELDGAQLFTRDQVREAFKNAKKPD